MLRPDGPVLRELIAQIGIDQGGGFGMHQSILSQVARPKISKPQPAPTSPSPNHPDRAARCRHRWCLPEIPARAGLPDRTSEDVRATRRSPRRASARVSAYRNWRIPRRCDPSDLTARWCPHRLPRSAPTGCAGSTRSATTGQQSSAHAHFRALGAEVGVRTTLVPNLQSSLTLWTLASSRS